MSRRPSPEGASGAHGWPPLDAIHAGQKPASFHRPPDASTDVQALLRSFCGQTILTDEAGAGRVIKGRAAGLPKEITLGSGGKGEAVRDSMPAKCSC